MAWVGIDFGNGFSSVSYRQRDGVEVIADSQGQRSTPSCVAFIDADVVVGEAVISQSHSNLKHTVFGIKQLLQWKFSDPQLQKILSKVDFTVAEGKDGRPVVQGKSKQYTLEELVSAVVGKMRETAEATLGGEVAGAVLAVPSSFDESQRAVLRKGAELAKFKKVRFISESAAAAIAFDLDVAVKGQSPKTFLVTDFGAGTFDVTVMRSDQGILTTLAADTRTDIGGNILDEALEAYLQKEFERKNKGTDLSKEDGAGARRKLRNAAEKAKRTLALNAEASIELDGLYDGIDFTHRISKARFEAMCGGLVRKAMSAITQTLEKAGVRSASLDTVLCVGGSSRLAKFQTAIAEAFGKNKIAASDGITPEEAVVFGAGEEADAGSAAEESKENSPPKTCARTLGVEVNGGAVFPMVRAGAVLPAKESHKFSVSGQSSVLVNVYQGERLLSKDLQQVASFAVEPKGSSVELTFEIDATGSMRIAAKEGGQELKIEAKATPSPEELAKEHSSAIANAGADAEAVLKSLEKESVEDEDDEDDSDDEGDEGESSEEESSDLADGLDDDLE